MEIRDSEPDLLDYIETAWRKKWLIVIPALVCAAAAGIIASLATPKWEVDAIILPGKFQVQTEQGRMEEVLVMDPKQLAGQINQASYDQALAAELGRDIRGFPRPRAENIRDTKLVRVSVRSADVAEARRILASLYARLRLEMDKRIEVEIKGLDTEIALKDNAIRENRINIRNLENQIALKGLQVEDQENQIRLKENEIKKRTNDLKLNDLEVQSREIQKERVKKEIEADRNKLKISEQRIASIQEELKTVRGRVAGLDGQLQQALGENKPRGDALGLLLYSNEVQENLRYSNALGDRMNDERITQENLLLSMHDKEEALRQIDTEIGQMNTKKDSLATAVDDVRTSIAVVLTGIRKIGKDVESVNNEIARIGNANDRLQAEIALLEQRRGLIDHARLVKEPTPSLYPVFPRKIESVIVAGLLGAILFTGVALIADRLQSRSRRRTVAAARAEAMLPWAAAAGHAVTALGRTGLYSEKIVSSQEEPRVGDVADRLNPAARVGRAVGGAGNL